MPPACPTERVFLVTSVLLCHFEEGTKEARDREISRIRASDQVFAGASERSSQKSQSSSSVFTALPIT